MFLSHGGEFGILLLVEGDGKAGLGVHRVLIRVKLAILNHTISGWFTLVHFRSDVNTLDVRFCTEALTEAPERHGRAQISNTDEADVLRSIPTVAKGLWRTVTARLPRGARGPRTGADRGAPSYGIALARDVDDVAVVEQSVDERRPLSNQPGPPHTWFGWTLCRVAISWIVLSPRSAS